MIANSKIKKQWTASTQSEVAVFFKRSPDTIALWRKKGMPGVSGKYDLQMILWWAIERGLLIDHALADDDSTGGDSPALERYRAARAQLAEFELERQKRTLVPRDAIRNGLSRFAHHLRQLAERMGKRHGPEAAITVNEAIDECGRVIDDEFGSN